MKKLTIIVILLTSLFFRCEKIDKDAPHCIEDKIRNFAKSNSCETASVGQWTFQGGNVYVFSEGSCGADGGAAVYNESCEQIGYLGGIAGNMTINNVRFYEVAVFNKIIWEE